MMDDLKVVESPTSAQVADLRRALSDFNIRATGYSDWDQLAIFVRNDAGTLEAGISALVWGECCEIELLWIDEPRRGQGLGRELLRRIEEEARTTGCHKSVLTTYSFQAQGFYEAHGYRAAGEVSDYPRGHTKYLMEKFLTG